jgi:hypothetical protein
MMEKVNEEKPKIEEKPKFEPEWNLLKAIGNLLCAEEHLAEYAGATEGEKQAKGLEVLDDTRYVRQLLANQIGVKNESLWCVLKHTLAAWVNLLELCAKRARAKKEAPVKQTFACSRLLVKVLELSVEEK